MSNSDVDALAHSQNLNIKVVVEARLKGDISDSDRYELEQQLIQCLLDDLQVIHIPLNSDHLYKSWVEQTRLAFGIKKYTFHFYAYIDADHTEEDLEFLRDELNTFVYLAGGRVPEEGEPTPTSFINLNVTT